MRPFIRLSLRQCPGAARAGLYDAGGGQQASYHRRVEGIAPLGWTPSFLVEDGGDGGAAVTRPIKRRRAFDQSGVGAERLQPRDRADQRVDRLVPAMPMAFQPDLLAAMTTVTRSRSSSNRQMV